MSNVDLFARMMADGRIPVRYGRIFHEVPIHLPGVAWERVEGMLLGLAIGDALGNTTESTNPAERHAMHGEIRDYLENLHAGGRRLGLPSDDTQLTFWSIEQMIFDGRFDPENVAQRFTTDRIFGIGGSVREFLRNFDDGRPWHEAGARSAGNGALMRIAALVVPHLANPSADLWADTVLATITTHNDEAAVLSSLGFIAILTELMVMEGAPEAEWWLHRFLEVTEPLQRQTTYRPRGGRYKDFHGRFVPYVEMAVKAAHRRQLNVREACDGWYSGAYLMETVPSVLYLLMEHGDDPEEAIVRAVNDTRDNDTCAAIVGAAVGALHGRSALPKRWIDGLLGRTGPDDDGRVFELLDEARRAFQPA